MIHKYVCTFGHIVLSGFLVHKIEFETNTGNYMDSNLTHSTFLGGLNFNRDVYKL